jgi:hypothetical protein
VYDEGPKENFNPSSLNVIVADLSNVRDEIDNTIHKNQSSDRFNNVFYNSFDQDPHHEAKKDEHNFATLVEKSKYEKLVTYTDKYPLLCLRKKAQYYRYQLTDLATKIIRNNIFEVISLIVIVANSVTLSLEDPTSDEKNETLEILDNVFLALYTLEMVLKICGMGFIWSKKSYLRDPWNVMDFIIVISAYVLLLISAESNLNTLRAFRVLRPLRTISGISGLKIIVSSLISAMSLLIDTMLILGFFLLIFAIGGTQIYTGQLKKRCVDIETGIRNPDNNYCSESGDCPSNEFCGKTMENPNYGISNFDNIYYSMLLIF